MNEGLKYMFAPNTYYTTKLQDVARDLNAVNAAAKANAALNNGLLPESSNQQTYVRNLTNKGNDTAGILGESLYGSAGDAAGMKIANDLFNQRLLTQTQINNRLADGATFASLNAQGFTKIDQSTYDTLVNTAKQNSEMQMQIGYMQTLGGTHDELLEKIKAIRDLDYSDVQAKDALIEKVKLLNQLAPLQVRTDEFAGFQCGFLEVACAAKRFCFAIGSRGH